MWRYEIKTECHACNAIRYCTSTLTQKKRNWSHATIYYRF